MNIELTLELEQLVEKKLNSGSYNSANDVVIEAMHLLIDRDLAKVEVRKKIADGVKSARAGRMVDGEEFMAQMIAELDDEVRAEEEMSKQVLTIKV